MTVALKDENSFHQLFQSLPMDEKLIEEYSCSYNEGGSVSIGRLYISQYHVSYAPKLGSTQIIIPIKDIGSISKKYSVYLFPNAIEIITVKEQKYFFSAFLSRDLAFATLSTIIHAGGGTRTKIFEDAMSADAADKIKNSSDDISLDSTQQQDGEVLMENYTSSRSSSTSSSSDDSVATNGVTTTPPQYSSTPPLSQSPSFKMLNSKLLDSTKKEDPLSTQDLSTNSDGTSDVDMVPETPNNSSFAPGSSTNSLSLSQQILNKERSNSASRETTPPLPVTPKKPHLEREASMNSALESKSNNEENKNSNFKPQQPQQQQQQQQSPTPTKKPTVNNNNNSNNHSTNLSQSFTASSIHHNNNHHHTNHNNHHNNSNHHNKDNLSHSTPGISTTATTNQNQTATVSSPSPSSIITSGIPFQSLPVKDKCDHIVTTEFEEQPWVSERFPISVEEFYNVVIRSDFWAQVNTTHSYTEQNVTEWKPANNCCIQRVMDFRTAISFKIGPKSTRVTQTQRCRLKGNELLMETSSVSKDVPYGDTFSVENLLSVVPAGNGTGIDAACTIKLSSKIKFTKTTWGIQSMIQKSATQGNKEFFLLWMSMVRNQIEAYAFNKIKSHKSSAAAPVATSTKLEQPIETVQPIPQPQPATTTTTATLSVATISTTKNGADAEQVSASSISLFTLWENLKSSEKQILYIAFALIFLLFTGLVWNVISNSSINSQLNQEIGKFSDTIVLLDAKLNSLKEGGGGDLVNDKIIITPTTLGTTRVESLQRQLEVATSLLERSQSLLSSLRGELAMESLKNKREMDLVASMDGGSSWFTILFTTALVVAPILYFTGTYQTIRDKLPF